MKFSSRAHYGANAMLDLALNYGDKPILLKNIAKRQEIPVRYLEHIMTYFISNGLVRSTRGKQGGFSLAKPPEKIYIGQIIQSVEEISFVKCVGKPELCKRSKICVMHDIWWKIKKAMLEVFDSITLKDMVKMQKNKILKNQSQIYYI